MAILAGVKQKPFWDAFDEIDIGTYAEALVAVFRFLPDEESVPLFVACLEPERADAVKICAIKAASILASEVFLMRIMQIVFHIIFLGGPASLAAFDGESPQNYRTEIQKDLRGTINLASPYRHRSCVWPDRLDALQ